MIATRIQEAARLINTANIKWWTDLVTGERITRNKGELLNLVHSEVSEWGGGEEFDEMDDKLPHRKMGEVEAADAVIRLMDFSFGMGYDLTTASLDAGFNSLLDIQQCKLLSVDYSLAGEKGLMKVNRAISVITELERKSRSKEVPAAIFAAISVIFGAASMRGYDVCGAIVEKMNFNAVRPDHSHEERSKEGGKKF